MSDAITRLNAALEGRYAIERELGDGEIKATAKPRNTKEVKMDSRTRLLGTLAFVGMFAAAPIHAVQLHDAAQSGDIEQVRRLVSLGADLETRNETGATALMLASQNGHGETASLLLSNGADVNVKADDGVTALIVAALYGHAEVVSLLLSSGAEVNAELNGGGTALYASSQNGHAEVVSLLLSSGAEVNAERNDGRTPLYVASQEGRAEVVSLLLSNGADVNMEITGGATPLFVASEYGHAEIVSPLLSNGADVNAQASNGATALMMASQAGHIETVRLLLSNGVDVNAQADRDVTALFLASLYGQAEIVSLLLSNGADVNMEADDGMTAIRIAQREGHEGIVEMLQATPEVLVSSNVAASQVDEQVDSVSGAVEDLERLIESGSAEADQIIPRIESMIIESIRQQGAGDRFVLDFQPQGQNSGSVTLEGRGELMVMNFEFPGDRASVSGGLPSPPLGDGSVWRFHNSVVLSPNTAIDGKGGKYNRLTFALIEGMGLMYLRGWGDVLLSGEEPVHLGQERSGPVGGSNASIGQVNNTTNNTDSPFIAASRASSAKITGEFQGVSFEAYARSDGGLRFSAAGGSGTLRNEGNEVIAEGGLATVDQALMIRGNRDASFYHVARTQAFADDDFADQAVEGFAAVQLSESSRWTLKDDDFRFLLELPHGLGTPLIVPNLDRSLARASIITLPEGTVSLWGFAITVESENGTVTFARGKPHRGVGSYL